MIKIADKVIIVYMNGQEKIRIYADTSVFGGVFDEEFKVPSMAFFHAIREQKLELQAHC